MARLALDQVLKKKNISKRQFAKMLRMPRYNNVFRLFHADMNPTLKTLTKWSKLLGVKVRDLIKE